MLTITGGLIGGLLGGAIILERVTSLPGLGQYTLTAIQQQDHNVVMAVTTYAVFLAHMRRFDEALDHLEKARALDPLSVETLMWLASLHIWRGEREQAMTRWREAKEIDPAYSELFQSVLTSLCGTDRHDEAIAVLDSGTQRFPNDPLVMGELAYCHAMAGASVGHVRLARIARARTRGSGREGGRLRSPGARLRGPRSPAPHAGPRPHLGTLARRPPVRGLDGADRAAAGVSLERVRYLPFRRGCARIGIDRG